ncbi:MAG: transglycosylase domain-containing protein, partial [bacterium]
MPRKKHRIIYIKLLEDLIFNLLLLIVNFFIGLGEATKIITLLPFKILLASYRYIRYLISKLFKFISKTTRQFIKFIFNLNISIKKRFLSLKKFIRLKFFKKKIYIKAPKIRVKILKIKFKFPRIKLWKFPKKAILKVKLIHWRSFSIGLIFALFLFSIINAYNFVKALPSPTNIGKTNYSLSTHIYDRNEKLLFDIYRDENRTPVKIEDLPNHIYQATIAIEDKDFFNHKGISLIGGIVRAIKENVTTGQLQGGSTITQQLV